MYSSVYNINESMLPIYTRPEREYKFLMFDADRWCVLWITTALITTAPTHISLKRRADYFRYCLVWSNASFAIMIHVKFHFINTSIRYPLICLRWLFFSQSLSVSKVSYKRLRNFEHLRNHSFIYWIIIIQMF